MPYDQDDAVPSDFGEALIQVLTTRAHVPDEEAHRSATEAARRYISSSGIGEGRWVVLWNVSFKWKAFCQDLISGEFALPDALFPGLPLFGALRWLEKMGGVYPRMNLDHVEAATCMALWQQEATAQPYSPNDTLDALLLRVNDILPAHGFATIDKARIQEAVHCLLKLKCLASRNGWHRLKEEVTFQISVE